MSEKLRAQPPSELYRFISKLTSIEAPATYAEYYSLTHEAGVPQALASFVSEHGTPHRKMPRVKTMAFKDKGWRVSATAQPLLNESPEVNHLTVERERRFMGRKTGNRDVVMFALTQHGSPMDSAIEDRWKHHGLYMPVNVHPDFIDEYAKMGDRPIYDGRTTGTIEADRARLETPDVIAGFMRVTARAINHFLRLVEVG
jgi:hypothetical protein